jgi:hypothetical protein
MEEKSRLFKESRDRTLGTIVQGLPGFTGHEGSMRDETGTCPRRCGSGTGPSTGNGYIDWQTWPVAR